MQNRFIQQLEPRVFLSATSAPMATAAFEPALASSTAPAQYSDNPATSARTQWWRDAKFGMFIHWGLYSQLAGHWNDQTTTGYGEWIMHDLHIPLDQYAHVANSFNPTLFNAQQWVQVAQSAGMRYIVMTAKHHDGFSMFDTSVNSYNVVDATPWHQDPIALMSAATHAAGLHFGVYYSILNWADANASAGGINTYMQTMETQLSELITHDHPDLLWFDGEWPSWWTDDLGQQLAGYVRGLDPAIIINNRVGKRLSTDGDYDTPEQMIPTNEPAGRLWETCMTLNDTWGYKDTDNNWKSAATIVDDSKKIEGAGGNLLLNVGPDGSGVIPAPAMKILGQVGQALNAKATGTGGSTPIATQPGTGTGTGDNAGSGAPSTGVSSSTGSTPPEGGTPAQGGTLNLGSGNAAPPSTTGNVYDNSTSGAAAAPIDSMVTASDSLVTIEISARKKYHYKNSHGHRVTISLKGPGIGQLQFTALSPDPARIILNGTDSHSSLTIFGRASIGDVTVNGSLHALIAPAVDLTGHVNVSGRLGRMKFPNKAGAQ